MSRHVNGQKIGITVSFSFSKLNNKHILSIHFVKVMSNKWFPCNKQFHRDL